MGEIWTCDRRAAHKRTGRARGQKLQGSDCGTHLEAVSGLASACMWWAEDEACFCTAVQASSVSLPWALATSARAFVARPPCAVKKAASLLTLTTPRPGAGIAVMVGTVLAPAPAAAELPL
ncbi:predicted protein [Pyrenophora tritici-repentis Pt-1C-BFP]|uniref:Uncharacterized protein n=1 Tax=Pyrenophora tritici-repentis (strain Pt-1C-BFP) TaxID=426418 RepID=B2VQU1_PYRTR|nr:uncharacterized protein PTRG_00435 [Pyrenophora tritici-repentis Pt-1C-BFP]EDU39873.1 predicted protein [Pyrenophora tritici-repentis Pt-1C-BFP]